MLKLVAVAPLDGYSLHVEYNDGVAGEVNLSQLVGRGVFKAWEDRSVFESVCIGEYGEIKWNDDIELCADAIYLQVTGKTADEVFPVLKAPADA
ncbi:MAG: DUF2442 domain-containing protein [Planctomycetes bacterium]|nr:DUF2442 domain-containing protein [Planctomycetota bacterium]